MGVYIKDMEMPTSCCECRFFVDAWCYAFKADDWRNAYNKPPKGERLANCPLVPVPPHGDLIDRDALIKDGWSNLHKEVIRMGGYAIHELPLKNPSIPVIIPAEEGE